jgi:feruloyl esterase
MRLLTSAVFLPALLPICFASEGFNNYERRDYIFSDPKSACSKLGASICIQNATVNFANFVPAGTNLSFTQDYGLNTCGYPNALVTSDMCRVAMHVSTSSRSGITLEAWLPVNWTGRFLSTGNGGESGCIQYTDMAYTAGLGFATVGSCPYSTNVHNILRLLGANNGHNGTTGIVSLLSFARVSSG